MATRAAFYWYDHREEIDLKQVQKSMDAVYNGKNVPVLVEIPNPGWDQNTIAICAERVDPNVARQVFLANLDEGADFWLSEERPPVIFDIH